MSTESMPSRYQPANRVVDDRDRLRELYCKRDLTIRQIASEYAEVGRSRVCSAIHEHGLTDEEQPADYSSNKRNSDRGTDPPDWSMLS